MRRVRGCPMGNPGAGYPPAPGGFAKASSGEVSDPPGLTPAPRDLAGSPRSPCGARVAAISVPVRSSACRWCQTLQVRHQYARLPCSRLAANGSPPLLALPRQRASRASWMLGPPFRPYLPGAGRLHVRRTDRSTSRRSRRRRMIDTAEIPRRLSAGHQFACVVSPGLAPARPAIPGGVNAIVSQGKALTPARRPCRRAPAASA